MFFGPGGFDEVDPDDLRAQGGWGFGRRKGDGFAIDAIA
ncbi:hypothetical protein SAMCFNEI73_Ch0865 [Sinorhizobium americanum]|uniref:Uncharacterized protein n=1 Tax=Sinorhizobium americanum TaxID=194963 RepID=A0A1L3LJC1_9HYPH|nr:hypothetical protein SAMCCGM7_Ch0867 [Sinorhizobium americanum CCGM7]APG90187.1 hypothetical protein SAMCFNEI73_Ch0865 [Sinorhizobium americanum]